MGLTPFVQAGASPEVDLPAAGSTVIVLCPDATARSIQPGVTASSGSVINRTAADVDISVYFRDALGNLALIGAASTVSAGTFDTFLYGSEADAATIVLAPGEAIVLLTVATPAPP
jgi:hypothetical protein